MLKVIIWDVQHGSAAYAETPAGKRLVFDLGTGSNEDATFSPLLHLRIKYDVRSLDALLISHPHADHISDIANLFLFDTVRTLYRPRDVTPAMIQSPQRLTSPEKMAEQIMLRNKYVQMDQEYTCAVGSESDVFLPQNNGGVCAQVFVPRCHTDANLNNHSLVTVIEYLGVKIVIPGDNEPPSWDTLVAQPAFVQAIRGAQIFVTPHHGRESGYYARLFDYFTPKLTVISDGPSTETDATDRYSKVSEGWNVWHRRTSTKENRKCVTTRSDGVVCVVVGRTIDGKARLEASID